MKKPFFLFLLLLQFTISAQTNSSVSFSEVMFYPLEANGEFIELYNTSSDSSVNLSKYHIIYSTSSADTIIEFNSGTILQANNYAVIFENDYDSTNGLYFQLITDSTLVLQIDNGRFGSSGMANTSDRTLYLLNGIADTIDVYTYSTNNKAGYSDEKINSAEQNDSANWGNSESQHGTPGFKNSISQRDYDLTIYSVSTSPENLFVESEIEFTLLIKNLGLKDATDFGLILFLDLNNDSLAQNNEIILDENQPLLPSNDSLEVTINKIFSTNGIFNLFAEIDFPSDERLANNYYSTQLLIRPKPNEYNDIVINEIMYKPNGDEPEWIEIFNRTNKRINLNDWRIADRTSKPLISDSTYYIEANEFLVLTEDETLLNYYKIPSNVLVLSLPSLNNAGDDLKMIDSLDQVIDSVSYNTEWGGSNGYSLERISTELYGNDSSNWKESVSKSFATPGMINSATVKEYDLSITKLLTPQRYGTVGDDFEVKIKVENIGFSTIDDFVIEIYHDVNFDSISQLDELSLSINGGFLDVGDSLTFTELLTDYFEETNSYIIKASTTNDDNIENNETTISFIGVLLNEMRGDIVINEIMHSPTSPEPEWVEVFNRSSKSINLKNYQIADNADTVNLLSNRIILNPNKYFVFADDSSFIEVYPEVENIIIAKLPNLNNGEDRIMILDSLNRVIDSLYYFDSWGGNSGKSLERIDVESASVDSANWKTTTQQIGGTPARVNSVSVKNYDIALTEIIFTPEVPKFGEAVFISVKIKNIGKRNSDFTLQLFEDLNLDSTSIQLHETSDFLSLNSNDSLVYQFIFEITAIKREYKFIVNGIFKNDEDIFNNSIEKSIFPGFRQSSIIINEIMYSPINGEPEWVELLNTTTNSININGFTISDIYTTPKTTILATTKYIKPNEYIVISKDSTIVDHHSSITSPMIITGFANLNNDIDGIVIRDSFGETIDSVEYKSNWGGNNGFSLERVLLTNSSTDSTNWRTSKDIELSTPGRKNSVTPFLNDLAIVEIKTIPEYPILGDNVFIEIKLENVGLNNIDVYSAKVEFKINNKLSILDEIESVDLSVGDSITLQSEYFFRLTDSAKIFIELKYLLDDDTLNNKGEITLHPGAKRNTILINEFMANPKTDEAEWIEIYNNSSKKVDVSNWFVSDLLGSTKLQKIANEPLFIEESGYIVISNDTSKFNISNINAVEVRFGALGNIEDGIIIYDFNQNIVDSLRYDKYWQIEKGRSLERVLHSEHSIDISNWLPSLSTTGASPGISNSILETSPAEINSVIISEIMFDPDVENSEFIELFNLTDNDIDIGGWELVIDEDNYFEISSSFLTIKPNDYFVVASDSIVFSNYNSLDKSKTKILESTSLSLSNNGESIVVIDHWGNTIDSLFYDPKWHNQNIATTKNKSLERISHTIETNESTNWSTSVSREGATPGKTNSIFVKNSKKETGISFSPNPFSPDNDGFEDFTIINFLLPYNTSQIRVKIFDDHGRLVRTLVNNEAVAQGGSIIFDGLNDNGNPLRIGMYIVFLEAVDTNSGEVTSFKDVIVIARKL